MYEYLDEIKIEKIKKAIKNKKYPKISLEKGKVCITFSAKDIQEKDMHKKETAFEGWLFALKDCINDEEIKIRMSLEGKIIFNDCQGNQKYIGQTYLSRFLYRVMKFREQYMWLELDETTNRCVDDFKNYISHGIFKNNIGAGKANKSKENYPENQMEGVFAEPGELSKELSNIIDIGNNVVNRQLPVGLFVDNVSRETPIFSFGHSAIDLWTWNEDEFNVVELKAHNAKTPEIFSEIFFYTNYMRDLICPEGLFTLNEDEKYIKRRLQYDKGNEGNQLRGYGYLRQRKRKIKKINGILLADDEDCFHPFVNEYTIKIMNQNSNIGIHYFKALYDHNRIIDKKNK